LQLCEEKTDLFFKGWKKKGGETKSDERKKIMSVPAKD